MYATHTYLQYISISVVLVYIHIYIYIILYIYYIIYICIILYIYYIIYILYYIYIFRSKHEHLNKNMGAAGKLCMTHGAKEKRYRRLKPQKRIKRAIVEVGSPSTVRLKS